MSSTYTNPCSTWADEGAFRYSYSGRSVSATAYAVEIVGRAAAGAAALPRGNIETTPQMTTKGTTTSSADDQPYTRRSPAGAPSGTTGASCLQAAGDALSWTSAGERGPGRPDAGASGSASWTYRRRRRATRVWHRRWPSIARDADAALCCRVRVEARSQPPATARTSATARSQTPSLLSRGLTPGPQLATARWGGRDAARPARFRWRRRRRSSGAAAS